MRTITVVGHGASRVAPDTAVVHVAATFSAASLAEALAGAESARASVVTVARRFTDLSHRLAELKDEDGPAPQIRNRVSGGLIRSRDFH